MMLSMDHRFQVGLLVSGGHRPTPVLREVEAYSYVSHLRLPVLMITGKQDNTHPRLMYVTFFQHLGSSDKKWIEMDAGHLLPWNEAVERMHQWLAPRLGRKAPMSRGPKPAINPRPSTR
jgi:hypothetical protein